MLCEWQYANFWGALWFQSLRGQYLSQKERSENMKLWIMQMIHIHMLHYGIEKVSKWVKKGMNEDENLM